MRKFLLTFLVALSGILTCGAQNTSRTNFRPWVNVSFSETSLPIVFINVNRQIIDREEKRLATMKIIDNGNGRNYTDTIAHPNQKVDWAGPVTIKYRGNSSFTASEKKPFAIRTLKTYDVKGKKDKVSILGMAKDNDWALLAPWQDKSYMRDVLTMELARGSHTFAPHMKYCELFLDGWYYGLYIMSERATDGKGRLNLDDPEASDLTGDFHVEIDRDDEAHYYRSKHHPVNSKGVEDRSKYVTYQYKEPEYEDFADLPAGTEQAIHNEIDKMEDAFASDDYKGENGYRKYIDVESFIDLEIAQELSNNVDAYRLSSPLYKYSETHAKKLGTDAKWKTALWDFNIAYGGANYNGADNNRAWRYNSNDYMAGDPQWVPFFWYKLMQDTAYVSQLHRRWAEQRNANYSDDHISAVIDSISNYLESSGVLDRENDAWHDHFGSFSSHVSSLKSFLKSRLSFMDKQWLPKSPSVITGSYTPVAIAEGFNQDVIAEGLPSDRYTTGGLDDSGFVFYSPTVKEDGAIGDDDRMVKCDNDITYQLADYDFYNALVMMDNGEYKLTFDKPINASSVSCLVMSADGGSDVTVVPNYTDGTNGNGDTESISDWHASSPSGDEALYGLARMYRSSSSRGNFDDRLEFRLYAITFDTNKDKQIESLTFTKSETSGNPTVFAVSAALATTGINKITTNSGTKTVEAVYGIDGTRRSGLAKGINIVKFSDGTTMKVVKK